jgi:predicted metal-dependent hydrolase
LSNKFDYQIRYSGRAKKVRLVVHPDKVEVVAPYGVPEKQLHAFVAEQSQWVEKTVKKIQAKVKAIKPFMPERYENGALIPFKGEFYPLHLKHLPKTRNYRVEFSADSGFVVNVNRLDVDQDEIRQSLRHWLFQQAASHTEYYVQQHAPRYQLWPRQLRIRQQKSRWGSCSGQNNININGLLILTPPAVMEYVVVHEICHIRHKNHSADFWQLVAEHLPDFQTQRNWLKQHGSRVLCGF